MADDDILEDLLSWKEKSTTLIRDTGLKLPTTPTNVLISSSSSKEAETCLSIPTDLNAELFDYQRDGVQWLYKKHCRARACLLADEMGLGKTVQVCVFLGALYSQKKIKTTIIVVPPTLLPMWVHALEQWGRLDNKVVEIVHNDPKGKRASRWKKLTYGLPCVMLTTYGVLRQDATNMSAVLVDYVVLDEAHLIRDASTQAFKGAITLSSRHKIALTGTPLMNSFEDMWSIFKFLDGSILNTSRSDFSAISAVLLHGNEKDASDQHRLRAESELTKLRAAIKPFMLRREKADVQAVCCVKHDTVVWVCLNELQRKQYELFVRSRFEGNTVLNPNGDEVEDDLSQLDEWVSGEGDASEKGGDVRPLVLLTALSQICNHPWFSLTDAGFHQALTNPFQVPCEEVGDIFGGPKLRVALHIITRCINASRRKCCVFSRTKRTLSMLAVLLQAWSISFTRVDGDVSSPSERTRAIREFNEDPQLWVCLLTTHVGGLGVSFHAASCVILMDPSWNPSADAQAVDRVHRIGQKHQDVLIFRLLTCGTVEEKVYRNQIFKSIAAKQSMQKSEEQSVEFHRYFTRIQLRNMFEIGDLDKSLTAAQLEVLHSNNVQPCVKDIVKDAPLVCALSDHGCVITEVSATAGVKADLIKETTTPLKRASKRTRSFSHSPPPTPCRRLSSAGGLDQSNPLSAASMGFEYSETERPPAMEVLESDENALLELSRDQNDDTVRAYVNTRSLERAGSLNLSESFKECVDEF
ncbi:unnamed protein product [Phytomonas sp. EM1]|nr:unnamed protein product [Phytomonas sp. EM1]|eukprot:CCW64212.1 unnamed protein product [Phytomonas sp. isolate EM1]